MRSRAPKFENVGYVPYKNKKISQCIAVTTPNRATISATFNNQAAPKRLFASATFVLS